MIKPSLGMIGVCATALAVVAAGLASVTVQAAPAGPPSTVFATDDTYVRPSLTSPAGQAGALVVGGSADAVTYVKFAVDSLPDGSDPLRVSLLLTPVRLAAVSASTEIDVHSVADTSWSEDTLTDSGAPALGPIIASSTLPVDAMSLRLDISVAIGRAGVYAFALTTPSDSPQRLFVSKEGGGPAGGPMMVMFRSSSPIPPPTGPPTQPPTQPPTSPPTGPPGSCVTGPKLVPSCGVLMGVAPGAHTGQDPAAALTAFESEVGHDQQIFHSYHRGIGSMFPNREEIAISQQAGHPRALFINWKPDVASWGSIANGNPMIDRYLDRLASYLQANYTQPFFFTVHHEPENDVIERPGSGYTAADYAAMYRHVVLRLRGDGVTNLVTVMDYMAFAPWNVQPWFNQLYPGDDVVDWIGWDMYGYSTPGAYGYGDFAEMLQRNAGRSQWPGIYAWASTRFPNKPFMVAEWGVWYGQADPNHPAAVFASVDAELAQYPQIKALVYFDTPDDSGHSTLVGGTPGSLAAYRAMEQLPTFQVSMPIP